ncbi:MAG: preprotein translocase subunit SecE [Blastocatellia bacterium]|nr:preprotein translocase subunit SecE [Blastocatellia bacterium]MCS7157749.1 preprotein translocase subunit SecE [Blastocatellia bacterium]MCX7753261.1 preprotein translocase subunit SecE [Blastocatellia bacterium]MDW8168176.1 preprotein translocase subunit SecE [Acidobacteriota bacterium]MDW8257587.1 preprotein translocase subunit SecE [Acidobacteriota bacterium]
MAKVAEGIEKKPLAAEPSWIARGFQWIARLPLRTGSWVVVKARAARQFYEDVKLELRKVSWPTWKEVYAQTIVVLIVVFFFGFFLYGTNWVLGYLVNKLFEYAAR